MFGKKAACGCGCGRVLQGQSCRFSTAGASVRHVLERIDEVLGRSVGRDSSEWEHLARLETRGRVLEADLFRVAHGGQRGPRLTVEEIDSWTVAATELIDGIRGSGARKR